MTNADKLIAIWARYYPALEELYRAQQDVRDALLALQADVLTSLDDVDPAYMRRLAAVSVTIHYGTGVDDMQLQYAAMTADKAKNIVGFRTNEEFLTRSIQFLADNNLPSLDQSWE